MLKIALIISSTRATRFADKPAAWLKDIVPIAELVGWTSLGGKVAVPTAAGPFAVRSATGDTIVNAKTGVRWKFNDAADLFAGYGKALTQQTWYDDTIRIELRLLF